MNEKLYDMMDWGRIEGLVYSEEDNPHDFLGAHLTDEGVLIQTFMPTASKVEVIVPGIKTHYMMEEEDEAGFFAVLLPKKSIPEYKLHVTFDDGSEQEMTDPYTFQPQIDRQDTKKFNAGICYDIYKKLGAHPMTVNGVDGVYFAVWAPNAVRVSLVGDFNLWDGRRLPMRRLWDSGIFEIFIPGLKAGTVYKYEVKAKGGLTYLKADPYAGEAEKRPNNASVVTDLNGFEWTDDDWMKARSEREEASAATCIYEVHLGSWKKPDDGREFYNYRELAPMLAEYCLQMGYTHLELMPVMEHPLDESWGYQTTGYYAPTSRFGNPKDFMFFMNYMHEKKIGVILDWCPSHFPKDTFGLYGFDGTDLYEKKEPGSNSEWGTAMFDFSRAEVKNFLIANALYWTREFHADGIRMDAVASMLYLDYGKNAGEWVSNIYGGNENLDAVEFLKHLNSIYKKQCKGAMLIAEEATAWPKVTGDLDDEGLGFDFKWNTGWMNDFLGYMQLDPVFRGYHHGDLLFSMIYNYSERFILSLPHSEFVQGKGSMLSKMPGSREKKFANLRATYGYFMTHPGKKMLFMGQDLAQISEWSEKKSVEWGLLEKENHAHMHAYVKALIELYRTNPALYEMDYDADGFEWINNISANENMLVFLRKTQKEEETLLIVCNFSPLSYENHKIGVPFCGKYKEIFSSDRTEFGGAGNINPRVKTSKADECDDRPDSIRILVPPMGISVFRCTRTEKTVSENEKAKTAKVKAENKKKAKAAVKTAKPEAAKKKTSLKEELEEKYTKAEEENKGGRK